MAARSASGVGVALLAGTRGGSGSGPMSRAELARAGLGAPAAPAVGWGAAGELSCCTGGWPGRIWVLN